MVSITEEQLQTEQGANHTEPRQGIHAAGTGKSDADGGPCILADMEHFVWLVRKVKNISLIRRLFKNEGIHVPEELAALMDKAKAVLPPRVRNKVFSLIAGTSPVTRQRLERIAERIALLDNEHGRQAVLSLLNETEPRDMVALEKHGDAHGRALHLYIEQEYPEKGEQYGARFDQAERVQTMYRQWKSENTSSHYRGPAGQTPVIDETMKARIKEKILLLYPKAPCDDIIIEQFTRRGVKHARNVDGGTDDSRVTLDTITVTFNGSEAHYKKVEHGEVVSHDDLAALSIKYSRDPSSGIISVFSDDREIRRDLAAMLRDVVLCADADIADMPMFEFDISPFVSPAILDSLKTNKIEGIESIRIQHLKIDKPHLCQSIEEANGHETAQQLSCPLTIGSDRRDTRDIYTIAREAHDKDDLSGYELAQLKLVMRIARNAYRRAHNVAVQLTAPNGFNDDSKTEEDRRLVMRQLEKIGIVRQF